MPTFTDRVKAAYKAFLSFGGTGGYNSGNWVDSNLPGNRYTSQRYSFEPQTNLNYASIVGDIWTNSAVQAVLNWIIRAWPESYPCVKEEVSKNGKKEKVEVLDHPLLAILQDPNSFDDDTVLWASTILSFWADGNAYWGINRKKNGDIAEFVYIPHHAIYPKRKEFGRGGYGPDFYEFHPGGSEIVQVDPRDVVHFRFGRDPNNYLYGMSGWASVARHCYTDNEASAFVASTLANRGSAWMILTPDGENASFADPEGIQKIVSERTKGDNRGGVLVLDGQAKVTMPPPMREQGVAEFHRISETRTCALAGIPAITVGLASGLERSTFNNTGEAETAAWYTIVAVQRMMGRQLTKQVLRPYDRTLDEAGAMLNLPGNFRDFEAQSTKRVYYAGFDYSDVRALQPDRTEEWKRYGEAYQLYSGITLDEYRAGIGYDAATPEQLIELKPPLPQEDATMPAQNGNGQNGKPPARNGNGRRALALAGKTNGHDGTADYDLPGEWVRRIEAELDTLEEEGEKEDGTD